MLTEEQIIYSILDKARGGSINNDEVISERELRVFLLKSRAFLISKNYINGLIVSDSEFQSFTGLNLTYLNNEYYADLPNLIRLSNNAGLKLSTKDGYNIPIMSKEQAQRSLNNPVGQFQPKAYLEENRLYVLNGLAYNGMMNQGAGLTSQIESINTLSVNLQCILYDPSDNPNYDWTTSNFPLASELVSIMMNNILKYDIALELQTKTDEVANMKNDNIRYHDQGKID